MCENSKYGWYGLAVHGNIWSGNFSFSSFKHSNWLLAHSVDVTSFFSFNFHLLQAFPSLGVKVLALHREIFEHGVEIFNGQALSNVDDQVTLELSTWTNLQHSCKGSSMNLRGLRRRGASLVKWVKFHRKMNHRSIKWVVPLSCIFELFHVRWRTFFDQSYLLLWSHRWRGRLRIWAGLPRPRQILDRLFEKSVLKLLKYANLFKCTWVYELSAIAIYNVIAKNWVQFS